MTQRNPWSAFKWILSFICVHHVYQGSYWVTVKSWLISSVDSFKPLSRADLPDKRVQLLSERCIRASVMSCRNCFFPAVISISCVPRCCFLFWPRSRMEFEDSDQRCERCNLWLMQTSKDHQDQSIMENMQSDSPYSVRGLYMTKVPSIFFFRIFWFWQEWGIRWPPPPGYILYRLLSSFAITVVKMATGYHTGLLLSAITHTASAPYNTFLFSRHRLSDRRQASSRWPVITARPLNLGFYRLLAAQISTDSFKLMKYILISWLEKDNY